MLDGVELAVQFFDSTKKCAYSRNTIRRQCSDTPNFFSGKGIKIFYFLFFYWVWMARFSIIIDLRPFVLIQKGQKIKTLAGRIVSSQRTDNSSRCFIRFLLQSIRSWGLALGFSFGLFLLWQVVVLSLFVCSKVKVK